MLAIIFERATQYFRTKKKRKEKELKPREKKKGDLSRPIIHFGLDICRYFARRRLHRRLQKAPKRPVTAFTLPEYAPGGELC